MNINLSDDIQKLKEYLKDSEVGSYLILVNSNQRDKYFIAYDFAGNPNDLIANTELNLLELKLRLVTSTMVAEHPGGILN